MGVTAAIMNDPEYDSVAMVERRQWRVALSAGPDRRKLTSTKREAIEWCEEMGVPYVIAAPPRPRHEVRHTPPPTHPTPPAPGSRDESEQTGTLAP